MVNRIKIILMINSINLIDNRIKLFCCLVIGFFGFSIEVLLYFLRMKIIVNSVNISNGFNVLNKKIIIFFIDVINLKCIFF